MKDTEAKILCALSNTFKTSDEQCLATEDIVVEVNGNNIKIIKDSNGAMKTFLDKFLYRETGDNMAMDWVENKNVENMQGSCKIIHCKDCEYYPRYKGLRPSEWLWPGVTDASGGCPCKTNHFSSSWIPDDDWFCRNGVGFIKDE